MKRLILYTYLLLIIHGFIAANVIPVNFRQHHNVQHTTTVPPNAFHRAPGKQPSLKYQQDTHHTDLFNYSCDKLKTYFAYHNYSEKNVLDQNMLYLSDEFVKLAKTYPGYEIAIATLRKKIRAMSPFGKWWREHIAGSYSPQLKTRIDQLYAEIHHKQQPQAPTVTPQTSHHMHKHTMADLRDDWAQCAANSYDQKTKEHLNKRINALDQHYTTTSSPPVYTHKDAYIFAQQHHINLHELTPNNSPAIGHILYQEYIDILDAAAHISAHDTEILCDALGQASSIGLEANKAGFVDQASKLADFCWTVLDYAQAVGEGVYLGATNTLHTLTHPIETAKNTLIGVGVIAYGLGKAIDTMNFMREAAFLYAIDSDRFFLRYNAIINQLETITDKVNKYLSSTSAKDILKQGTAFATEGVLLAKIFTLAQNISHRMLPVAQHCLESITTEEPLACLTNGELIPIKMPTGMDIGSLEGNILQMERTQLPNHLANNALTNNYYEVNGFKFTQYYYDRLWENGRKFPGFRAESILNGATNVIQDPQGYPGFYKYIHDGWEMIFNPETKIVAHLSKIKTTYKG